MNRTIHYQNINLLLKKIEKAIGIDFTDSSHKNLIRALEEITEEKDFKSVQHLINWLVTEPDSAQRIKSVAAFMTIGETYFCREIHHFEAMNQLILEKFMYEKEIKEPIKVWCAGCATGEEALTLAIFLNQISHILMNRKVEIHATDINQSAIDYGKQGVYRKWSFRDVPDWFKETYFIMETSNSFRVRDYIKEMVTFKPLNLLDPTDLVLHAELKQLDFIFCRNVLMYFSEAQKRKVIDHFHSTLKEKGGLFVASCEVRDDLFQPFKGRRLGKTTIYEKKTSVANTIFNPRAERNIKAQKLSDNLSKRVDINSNSVNYEIIRNLIIEGNYHEALDTISTSYSIENMSLELQKLECKLYANIGDTYRAAKKVKEMLDLYPFDSELYYLQGIILLENKTYSEAEEAFLRAIMLNERMVLSYYYLGSLYARRKELSKAKSYLTKALSYLSDGGQSYTLFDMEGVNPTLLSQSIEGLLLNIGLFGGNQYEV